MTSGTTCNKISSGSITKRRSNRKLGQKDKHHIQSMELTLNAALSERQEVQSTFSSHTDFPENNERHFEKLRSDHIDVQLQLQAYQNEIEDLRKTNLNLLTKGAEYSLELQKIRVENANIRAQNEAKNVEISSSSATTIPLEDSEQFVRSNLRKLEILLQEERQQKFLLQSENDKLKKLAHQKCEKKEDLERKDREHGKFHEDSSRPEVIRRINSMSKTMSKSRILKSLGMVKNRWQPTKELGSGSYGLVCEAIDTFTGGLVAVKIETRANSPLSLHEEAGIYRGRKQLSLEQPQYAAPPDVYYNGKQNYVSVMVMQRLGPTLKTCWESLGSKMPIVMAMQVGIQIVNELESIHKMGLVHCDIKPENVVAGLGTPGKWHLIDYGLCRWWHCGKSRKHLPQSEGNGFAGTVCFASIDAHRGIIPSRRADIESLMYTLIYLIKGGLPWTGIQCMNQADYFCQVYSRKVSLTAEDLCGDLPIEMLGLMRLVQQLEYAEKPPYKVIREGLGRVVEKNRK